MRYPAGIRPFKSREEKEHAKEREKATTTNSK
jgi:hypothetical protein